MARNKTNFHYQFHEEPKPSLHTAAKYHWACHKFEADGDGVPIETYYIWSDSPDAEFDGTTHCSCPAAYHARRPNFHDKHIQWLQRWLAIQKQREAELQKPSNQRRRELLNPCYYDAQKDQFFPFPILALLDDDQDP